MSQTYQRLVGLLCLGLAACDPATPACGNSADGCGSIGAGSGGAGGSSGLGTGGSGSGGSVPGGSGGSVPGGSGGNTGSGGAPATGGSGGAMAPTDAGVVADTGAPGASDGGPTRPKSILLVTRSGGGYRHESIEAAAAAIKAALMPMGITAEISDQLTHFTATGLARFGTVVLVSASGSVFGPVTSPEVTAFLAWVRAGGGVVGIHAATALAYEGTSAYVQMLGGKFIGHPGNIRNANCYPEGNHVSTARLPATFPMRDEIYTYSNRRADSTIVVRCDAFGSNEKIPLSWYHREGEGRVFSTGLGHGTELWAAGGRLLPDHVVPAILWTLGL